MKKRGPRGRNFTPDERAIMLKIALSGGSVDDINKDLRAHQISEGLSERVISEGSFQMLTNVYLSHIRNDTASRDHIFHPAPMGKLKVREAIRREKEENA